jgi:hypothetical protein
VATAKIVFYDAQLFVQNILPIFEPTLCRLGPFLLTAGRTSQCSNQRANSLDEDVPASLHFHGKYAAANGTGNSLPSEIRALNSLAAVVNDNKSEKWEAFCSCCVANLTGSFPQLVARPSEFILTPCPVVVAGVCPTRSWHLPSPAHAERWGPLENHELV